VYDLIFRSTYYKITNASIAFIVGQCLLDPKTVAWLKTNIDPIFGYPNIVRFSWATCKTLLETSGTTVRWYAVNRMLITRFFVGKFTRFSNRVINHRTFFLGLMMTKANHNRGSRHYLVNRRTMEGRLLNRNGNTLHLRPKLPLGRGHNSCRI
jgi:hypothetical protein